MLKQKKYNNCSMNSEKSGVAEDKIHLSNERGIFILATGLIIVTLFVFTALGIEVGRWYVTRAELSKAVDAASLIGAKNLSNPYLVGAGFANGNVDLMQEVAKANFSPGFMGSDTPSFVASEIGQGKVQVEGDANVFNRISRVLELQPGSTPGQYESMHVSASGAAQQRNVEIMMVLDKSGSMGGSPINNLKTASKSFLDFFESTQDSDKFGLITFASGVEVDFPMGHNFVSPMKTSIDNIIASGGTNSEDAIDQSDDSTTGFSDQTFASGDQRVQQFLIFFSDGNPTAFRGLFTRDGTDYDAVGYAANWDIKLMDPTQQFQYLNVKQFNTGDGLPTSSTSCVSGSPPTGYSNTKWHILEDFRYGVGSQYAPTSITSPDQCNISWNTMLSYVNTISKQMAIDHAQELKDKGISIYTIGLGSVDQNFMSAIASGSAFEYYTPDSAELQDLFQKIATNIKLRLIQ